MALFTSYAQNFEDVMLWRALQEVSGGFYIDIGAASPGHLSVTKAFYERGWSGINVEPNASYFSELVASRLRDINLQRAIGEADTSVEFYLIPGTGLSTLDKTVATHHQSQGHKVELMTVELMRLEQLFLQYASDKDVHFLKIDVEGAEYSVVKGNDWVRFRPWVVVLEATTPLSESENFSSWEPLLLKNEYSFVYSDGINRFYLAKERVYLSPAFRCPPNAFDFFDWDPIGEKKESMERLQQSEDRIKEAEDRIKKAEVKVDEMKSSFFWRLTYPLRWLSGNLRIALTKLKRKKQRVLMNVFGIKNSIRRLLKKNPRKSISITSIRNEVEEGEVEIFLSGLTSKIDAARKEI